MDFRKEIRLKRVKDIDKKIYEKIDKRLNNLQCKADVEEYKIQIADRRKFFKHIFDNYDEYMFDLDKRIELLAPKNIEKNEEKMVNYIYILDQKMKDIILELLDNMYHKIELSSKVDDNIDVLVQILERRVRLEKLLSNYDLFRSYSDKIMNIDR